MVQDAIHKERDWFASAGIEVFGTDRSRKPAQHLLPRTCLTSPPVSDDVLSPDRTRLRQQKVHLRAWLYPGYLAGDFRPVPELVEFTSGPAMKRTALCFVVATGWIRNCEKPCISLPSPPYCPAMCEPSCEKADHQ